MDQIKNLLELRKKYLLNLIEEKDYDYKILQACRKELAAILNYNACYPLNNAETIYETLHKERQKLIHPISETDEQFIEKWKSVKYKGENLILTHETLLNPLNQKSLMNKIKHYFQ